MAEPAVLDYYCGQEANQYSFYRIPKALFTEERFRRILAETKVLYGLRLNRMSLSVKNDWMDAENRVFIYSTLEDTLKLLCCGHTPQGERPTGATAATRAWCSARRFCAAPGVWGPPQQAERIFLSIACGRTPSHSRLPLCFIHISVFSICISPKSQRGRNTVQELGPPNHPAGIPHRRFPPPQAPALG